MGLSRSSLPTGFFCEYCQRDTRFLAIHHAIDLVKVCRSTIYYWMERDLIHWRELPSGRRIICQESLSRHARKNCGNLSPSRRNSPKLSNSIQSGTLTQRKSPPTLQL
jgi:hypothetical protein